MIYPFIFIYKWNNDIYIYSWGIWLYLWNNGLYIILYIPFIWLYWDDHIEIYTVNREYILRIYIYIFHYIWHHYTVNAFIQGIYWRLIIHDGESLLTNQCNETTVLNTAHVGLSENNVPLNVLHDLYVSPWKSMVIIVGVTILAMG